MRQEQAAPAIVICLPEGFDDSVLHDILCGVEEESVPCRVLYSVGGAAELAYRAAEQSPLEVGIGIDARELAVHCRSLPPGSPLFRLDWHTQRAGVRSACSNAARLVKGIPFILDE